jgi:hypothetical protein
MLDEFILGGLAFVLGGGVSFGYLYWLITAGKVEGVEPHYIEGRGDRSPHVHHYDTMDPKTNGKFVCGTCRKAKPR